jgi:hypothetical protein
VRQVAAHRLARERVGEEDDAALPAAEPLRRLPREEEAGAGVQAEAAVPDGFVRVLERARGRSSPRSGPGSRARRARPRRPGRARGTAPGRRARRAARRRGVPSRGSRRRSARPRRRRSGSGPRRRRRRARARGRSRAPRAPRRR